MNIILQVLYYFYRSKKGLKPAVVVMAELSPGSSAEDVVQAMETLIQDVEHALAKAQELAAGQRSDQGVKPHTIMTV